MLTAPSGTVTVKQVTSTLHFEHHDGDAWDGNGPEGYKLPAETVLNLCLLAAGDAHDAMGRALRRVQDEASSDGPEP